jgi:hypothetical protein
MNIAVINFSGNVGKSTIARHLLAPRIRDAKVIAIESINADDGAQETDEKLRGRQFSELQARLLSGDNVVVDVGASNVESFVALMSEFDGSHDDFDLFVVPVVSAEIWVSIARESSWSSIRSIECSDSRKANSARFLASMTTTVRSAWIVTQLSIKATFISTPLMLAAACTTC